MAAKFIPGDDRVMVAVLDQEHAIEGVLLPDSAKEDMQLGKVVARSQKVNQYDLGDVVLFGPWAGKNIQLDGVPFRVMKEGEIDGKVIHD